MSPLTRKLAALKVDKSVVIPRKQQNGVHKRAERLGIKVAVRSIPAGRNAGKLEVFRLK